MRTFPKKNLTFSGMKYGGLGGNFHSFLPFRFALRYSLTRPSSCTTVAEEGLVGATANFGAVLLEQFKSLPKLIIGCSKVYLFDEIKSLLAKDAEFAESLWL